MERTWEDAQTEWPDMAVAEERLSQAEKTKAQRQKDWLEACGRLGLKRQVHD